MARNEKISEERNMFVVKSNDLIEKTRYRLSLEEQRILLYIISKIKPEDEKFHTIQIEIKEFCKVCGIDLIKMPEMYSYIKQTVKSLANSEWMAVDEENEVLFRWIDKAKANKRSGIVEVKLNDDLIPYLLGLRENYTQYTLLSVLPMKSKYSIRLYEILRAQLWRNHSYKEIEYDIIELQKKLSINDNSAYSKNFTLFKKTVIERAVEEISLYTDLAVEVEYKKIGRSYKRIKFILRQLKFEPWLENQYRADKELDERAGIEQDGSKIY